MFHPKDLSKMSKDELLAEFTRATLYQNMCVGTATALRTLQLATACLIIIYGNQPGHQGFADALIVAQSAAEKRQPFLLNEVTRAENYLMLIRDVSKMDLEVDFQMPVPEGDETRDFMTGFIDFLNHKISEEE